jgi:acyl-coenzyme A thioesterase PaaI-like protein
MNTTLLRFGMNLWPPFLLAGIHVTHFAADARHARVELRSRPWNRNYVGTHFGGSLFAMTDPFWMILILRSLGRDYLVWDQAGEIQFVKPGRGTVVADFRLAEATLDGIRAACADGTKHLIWLPVDVTDASGEVVARVRKQIYIRLKPAQRAQKTEAL